MRTRDRFIIGLILAVALVSSVAACSGGDKDAGPTTPGPGTPGTTTVDVFTPGLVFSPAFISITVGSTVRFNITGVAHDVTFQAMTGAPQSIPVVTNQTHSRTFTVKGTFPFDCFTHPGMSGSVSVQ